MTYSWQRWMATEFRAAGLRVVEVDGWRNRGRPATTGGYNPTAGLLDHHTGTTTSDARPHPTLQTLIVGRSDLPGPLAPWSVDYDGVVWVIAAGRCNHAGRTNKPFAGVAAGADGNYHFMGDEVDTNGTQRMPPAQRRSLAITNAVYLDHFHRPLTALGRHADVTTRKWDIGSISTATIRTDVVAYRKENEDMPLTDADLKKIRTVVREEVARFVGDVVAVDPSDPDYNPENKTIRVSTSLTRIMRRTGKAPGQ
jgi:hypothetical protein